MQVCGHAHDAMLSQACQHCMIGYYRCMAAGAPQNTCQGLGADDWGLGCHPTGQIGGRACWRLIFLQHLHREAWLGGRQSPRCLQVAMQHVMKHMIDLRCGVCLCVLLGQLPPGKGLVCDRVPSRQGAKEAGTWHDEQARELQKHQVMSLRQLERSRSSPLVLLPPRQRPR